MSTIFNYAGLKDTVSRVGLPGQKSKATPLDYVVALSSSDSNILENGMLVKVAIDGNGVKRAEPIEASDTADKIAGVVLQDLRGQACLTEAFGESQIIHEYPKGAEVSVLAKGVVWLPVQDNGAITAGKSVYVRNTVDGEAGKPVGGIESGSGVGNIEVKAMKFTGRVGFPVASKQDHTQNENLTARVAEVVIDLPMVA